MRLPVSKSASSDALLPHSLLMSGKIDRTMYRLRLLFEMEKVKKLTEEEEVIERGDEEIKAGEECRIC